MVRHRPIQGESNIDFVGESEGSLPPRQDSFPDAGEAINDFWSMSGSFIFRHHVEPRVKLYSPKEESFPIPLKYIDVSRTTHTNLDVKQEKRIDEEREFVVDSGASMHMISKKDFSNAEMDILTKSCSPTIVITANGEVQTHEEAIVYVKELDIFLTMKILENTPAVLSLGKALR